MQPSITREENKGLARMCHTHCLGLGSSLEFFVVHYVLTWQGKETTLCFRALSWSLMFHVLIITLGHKLCCYYQILRNALARYC